MKKTLSTICLIVVAYLASAQNFEGEVVYNNTYTSNNPSLPADKFSAMMGSVNNYYIKDGQYKSETNGSFALWQLYIKSENKLYSKLANSKAILWNDGAENTDQVLSTEIHKKAAIILGYECDEVILHCKSGRQEYYYSSKFPINANLYQKHAYGNWYEYLKLAGALPLKMVIESPQINVTSIATEIKPEKIDDAFFHLPENIEIMKNPYQ